MSQAFTAGCIIKDGVRVVDSSVGALAVQGGASLNGNLTFGVDALDIQANNNDDDYLQLMARDNGVGPVEVARLQGAADPYFSAGGAQQFKIYNSGPMEHSGEIYHSNRYLSCSNEDPSSTADYVIIHGYDLGVGRRTLALGTEETVAVEAALASTHTLAVRINGATYRIMLTNA